MPVRCTWNPTRIGSSLPAAHAVRGTAPNAIDAVPAIAAAPAVAAVALSRSRRETLRSSAPVFLSAPVSALSLLMYLPPDAETSVRERRRELRATLSPAVVYSMTR